MRIVSVEVSQHDWARDTARIELVVLADSHQDRDMLRCPPSDKVPTTDGSVILAWLAELMAVALQAPSVPEGSKLAPLIAVSLRPQVDCAASSVMVLQPGETQTVPFGLVAIAASGELVKLTLPLEVRATIQ